MKAFKNMILLALFLALASACGDDAEKKPNNANNANNANNLNNANNANNFNNANNGSGTELDNLLKNTACEAAFECTSPFLTPILGRYSSVAECKSDGALSIFGDVSTGELDDAIAKGRVTFNSADLNACISELKAGLCGGTFQVESPECEAIVQGNVEEGGNCANSQECANGMRCDRNFDDEQCFGTCQPNCGEENCTSSEYCQGGETCAPRISEGNACDGFDSCEEGLYCRNEICTAGGDIAAGGSCDDSRDCASGLTCFQDTCITINAASTGQMCDIPFGQAEGTSLNICQAGTVCTNLSIQAGSPTGTCGAPKIQGAECNLFAECAIGLTCDATDPTQGGNCVPTYADGEECTADFDCQSNNCSDGQCVALSEAETCIVP